MRRFNLIITVVAFESDKKICHDLRVSTFYSRVNVEIFLTGGDLRDVLRLCALLSNAAKQFRARNRGVTDQALHRPVDPRH